MGKPSQHFEPILEFVVPPNFYLELAPPPPLSIMMALWLHVHNIWQCARIKNTIVALLPFWSVVFSVENWFKLVNWFPKLVQNGQLGCPRTRSTLDPHWSSHFGPSDDPNQAFPCFGPIWSVSGPPGPKLGVPWILKLDQIRRVGCPRTRSTLDPHWSSRFALP